MTHFEELDLGKIKQLGLEADVRQFNVPQLQIRSSDDPQLAGVVSGLAVPYNVITENTPWGDEQIASAAVVNVITADDPLPLRMEHAITVGTIFAGANTEAGYEIQAQILSTRDGEDLKKLIAGKAIRSFSIGFEPLHGMRDTETGLITWDQIRLFEVSAVTRPAYDTAKIAAIRSAVTTDLHEAPHKASPASAIDAAPTQARQADQIDPGTTPEKESNMTDNTVEVASREDITAALRSAVEAGNAKAEVIELKSEMAELTRSIALLSETTGAAVQTEDRTPGAFLRAVHRGEERATSEYAEIQKRNYDGEVLADTNVQPQWVRDLTTIIDKAAPLKSVFSKGVLPDTGVTLEYGRLQNNSLQVAEQVNEGDDLVFGKLSVTTDSTPVKTFGGWTSISRRVIDRAPTSFLDLSLRGLAIAAGQGANGFLRSTYVGARTANVTGSNNVKLAKTYDGMDAISALIDAAGLAQDNGIALDTLVSDRKFFKNLFTLTDSAGRPFFTISGTGVNAIGTANPAALKGDLAGVTVTLDPGLSDNQSAFVASEAIRFYTTNGVSLQDDNIINLTKDYSIYFYGAAAVEIPNAIIPIVVATS